jgi:hypothetical protein
MVVTGWRGELPAPTTPSWPGAGQPTKLHRQVSVVTDGSAWVSARRDACDPIATMEPTTVVPTRKG